ncbi:MAG TPA: Wzz/FepE/Etk N-terminal domain-containing protein, partial [Actinomycetota bacterium]
MSSTAEQASELRDQLRVIRTHKWQIALITLLVTGTAVFASVRRTPIYEAHTEVLVHPIVNPNSSGLALPQPPNLDTERLVALSQTVA